jgi:hypothetical protein
MRAARSTATRRRSAARGPTPVRLSVFGPSTSLRAAIWSISASSR